MSFCSVYIPVGVPTYHLETAQDQFERSCAMLRGVDPDFVCPDEMLLTLDKLRAYLDGLNPDLIVFQNLTFANAAYMAEVLRRYQCPMLLWTLREPVIDGGRLRLNSLTGAYSAANTLAAFDGRAFNWCFGAPEEESVVSAVKATVEAAKVKKAMRSLTMSAIGHTPQGFGFGRALDSELMNTFGVELESIEARELIDMAKTYTDEECAEYLRDTEKCTCGLDKTPEPDASHRRPGFPLLARLLHLLRHAGLHRAQHAERRGCCRRLRGRHLRRTLHVDRHAAVQRTCLLRRSGRAG